jgi:hypothetical protein
MEGIRVQGQTGRSHATAAVHCALSIAHRLANLVCRHGLARGIPVDFAFRLETFAQRPRHALPPRQQSISGDAAALRASPALSLSVCADRRTAWWKREPLDEWLPALSTSDAGLLRFLEAMDWRDC